MDQNKKIISLVVAMLVVAGFAYWGVKHGWFVKKSANPQSSPATLNSNIQQMSGGELPPDMPKDIILPKDAKVINSYTAVAPDGQSQSTLVYDTAESLGALNQAYFAYFAKNNWGVQIARSSVNASTTQMLPFDKQALVAVQQGKTLSIKLSQNPAGGNQWTVIINLLIEPKK